MRRNSLHHPFSVFLRLRAWRSCVKVQHPMAGWEQLWGNKEARCATTHPLEFRHLQKSKNTLGQMGHVHEQRRWTQNISSKLPSLWNCLCGRCPSHSWGHRGGHPKSQPCQVRFLLRDWRSVQTSQIISYGDGGGEWWDCPGPSKCTFSLSCLLTRETTYGRMWCFTSDQSRGDTAYSQIGLDRHTDTSYFHEPCG